MDAWKKYVDTATGLTDVTRKRAERVVRALVKQGELAADQVERTVDDLLKRSEKNRKVIASLVRSEVERTVDRLGLAREKDIDRLRSKVSKLEGSRTGTASAGTMTTASAARKSSAAKKSSTARKSSAAKKSATRKSSPKKTAAKKSTAKKSSPKKTAAKKSTAKKSAPAKKAANKAVAKNVAPAKATPPSPPRVDSPATDAGSGPGASGNGSAS